MATADERDEWLVERVAAVCGRFTMQALYGGFLISHSSEILEHYPAGALRIGHLALAAERLVARGVLQRQSAGEWVLCRALESPSTPSATSPGVVGRRFVVRAQIPIVTPLPGTLLPYDPDRTYTATDAGTVFSPAADEEIVMSYSEGGTAKGVRGWSPERLRDDAAAECVMAATSGLAWRGDHTDPLWRAWVTAMEPVLMARRTRGCLTMRDVRASVCGWIRDYPRGLGKDDMQAVAAVLVDVSPPFLLTPRLWVRRERAAGMVAPGILLSDRYRRYAIACNDARRRRIPMPVPVRRGIVSEVLRLFVPGLPVPGDRARADAYLATKALCSILHADGVNPHALSVDLVPRTDGDAVADAGALLWRAMVEHGFVQNDDFYSDFEASLARQRERQRNDEIEVEWHP